MISIFNMDGEQVMQDVNITQNHLELDVSTLVKGIYLVKIRTKLGIETKKIVIQ